MYERQIQKARLAGYGSLFSELSGLSKQFAGEQSAIYQAMFAASKAFSIANAIVSIQTGIANAFKLPFPANLAAAASVAAQTASIVSTIQSTTMSGQAHDGIDSVPNSGTWNLEKGERVIDRRTNFDLKEYLQRQKSGSGGGGATVNFAPVINVQAQPGASHQQAQQQARAIGAVIDNRFKKLVVDEKRPGGLLAGT